MAINFGKDKETLFAPTDLMSFGKAFSRMAAQPLDMYEVWYNYDALVKYAANIDSATATAYVGQKVTYIDANNKVTHYSIEANGSLKELGTTFIVDDISIVANENNVISLKGINSLTFEKEVEGKKEEIKFQPLMTKNGLIWTESNNTDIEVLTNRIDSLETTVGKAANDENAATGIFKTIEEIEIEIQNTKKSIDDFLIGTGAAEVIDTLVDIQGALDNLVDPIELAKAISDKADKDYVGNIPSNYTETNVIAYINKKAEEVLSQATGGSSESAASVKLALDTYKAENEPKFAKLDNIEKGAQVNVLEGIQVDGVDLIITDKKVNIQLKAISDQADKGVNDAEKAQAKADDAYDLANRAIAAAEKALTDAKAYVDTALAWQEMLVLE